MGRHTATRERGSIALEFAFAAPIVLLMLALAWTFGRVAWANGHLEAGTRDAARVATQALSAALGGTQSLHTDSYDEALALPTEEGRPASRCAPSRSSPTRPGPPTWPTPSGARRTWSG